MTTRRAPWRRNRRTARPAKHSGRVANAVVVPAQRVPIASFARYLGGARVGRLVR